MKAKFYVDYTNKGLDEYTLTGKNWKEIGYKATEIIDEFTQEQRGKIYCFTLEDMKNNVFGRFRPYAKTINNTEYILFGFHFE